MKEKEKSIGSEYFKTIMDRINWIELFGGNKAIPLKDKINIALMVELNANLAFLTQAMFAAMGASEDGTVGGREPNLVECPNCKKQVVPNTLGYCPTKGCKTDLLRYINSNEFHLGKKVDG